MAAGWPLRHRLGVAFTAVAVVLALLTGFAIFVTIRYVMTSNDVIYRWQRGVAISERYLADLVNQESGVRGYALGRQEQFLQPYVQYAAQERADESALRGYAGGDVPLHHLIDRAVAAADVWRRTVAEPMIAQVRAGGTPGAAALRAGKTRFDTIRVRVAAMYTAFLARSRAHRATRTTEGYLLLAAAGLALLMIAAAGVVLWRGLHRWVLTPVDALGAQTREVASGETHREIVPSGPAEFFDLGHDVEGMRRQIATQLDHAESTRLELERSSDELARSNEDLQQFAYVASHDLSEPLRKVANFCQLLERQYADELDDRARQYIGFAVDGAKRMQALISDLLALSRVGRSTDAFEPIDLDKKLDQALANLSDKTAQADARIERLTPLPTVDGDRALLISLFENLVGNAVKYRRPGVAPVIRIGAERDADRRRWEFSVTDNGIGIDPQYADRIFAVFQRLHLRDEYGGTGIGLALCRRIVEFHGGQIWLADVESGRSCGPGSDVGASFRFVLPESGPRAESRD